MFLLLVRSIEKWVFLVKLKNKDATSVRESFAKEFRHLPQGLKRTLTYDQGQETDSAMIESFKNHLIHGALATCATMRPSVDIAFVD